MQPVFPSPSQPALAFERVTKRFGDLTAIRDISFAVRPGEFVAIVGPSGSGKSTLLNLVAGLVVAADGVNSRLRDGLGLTRRRRAMPDGAIRALVPYAPGEEAAIDANRTIEYWSGQRRVLHTPCSDGQLYVALTMLDRDRVATAVPVDVASWSRAFPHLASLFPRIGGDARYDRFGYVSLKSWFSGRVAVLGDAAHALPPNIGQGAGCSMMNALSLADHLERIPDMGQALARWERTERPLTQHTQRVSVFLGLPTTWPAPLRRLFFGLAGRSRVLTEMRTRTARHVPTGTPAHDNP